MRSFRFMPVVPGISRIVLIACGVLVLTAQTVYSATVDPPSETSTTKITSREEWSGMYLSGQKVGYAQVTVEPTTFAGKPALKESSHSVLKMVLLGQSMQEEENSVTISDLKSLPIRETINVASNGSNMHLVAEYDYSAHKIICTLGSGAGSSLKTIDIPPGANLAGDVDFVTAGRKLVVGEEFDVYTLEPTKIALEKIHIKIDGRQEILNEAGKKIPTFVTKETLPIGESTVWVNAQGETIKAEVSLGVVQIVMAAESKQHAMDATFFSPTVSASGAPAYSPPADLAVVTSVHTDKAIDDPRKLKSLHAVMGGIPSSRLIVSDARQKETVVGRSIAPLKVDLQITSETPDLANTAKIPVTDGSVSMYLQKAPYLNIYDEGLRKTALRLRGSETDTYKIALTIRDWVHQNMTPDASIGVPRSATDVFGRKRGVCRDYATLYAALARIAGVPTRLCAGVVYADLDGKGAFYYHAWDECYIGGGHWVAIDPTLYDASLGIDYVDATHIKFAQGDVTEMYDAVSVVGKLKITIQ